MSVRKIAALAGLSPSAVSLALHGDPKLPIATRRRVQRIARKLGYQRDGRVSELMNHIRRSRAPKQAACFGVISLYDRKRPWELSQHLHLIYQSMERRADALGYRLEPLWLQQPGMTPRRFRSILEARGIQGLLCFGGQAVDDELPRELDGYAIVTQGLSIKTPLHRVVSHVSNDIWRILDRVYKLGYRRPGFVIGRYEEERSGHSHRCVYLGWCQIVLGSPTAIPVLQLDRMEETPLLRWLDLHRPDVVILVHHYDVLNDFERLLRRYRLSVPSEFGVAVVTQILDGTRFSGFQENQDLLGAWCVDMLVARVLNRDFSLPSNPRIEMVERRWIEGRTLLPRSA